MTALELPLAELGEGGPESVARKRRAGRAQSPSGMVDLLDQGFIELLPGVFR
jgi:hypothetical protein